LEEVEYTKKYEGEGGSGHISIVPNKDKPKTDILVIPKKGDAESERSVTEMVNRLKKEEVSHNEIMKIVEWVGEKLK